MLTIKNRNCYRRRIFTVGGFIEDEFGYSRRTFTAEQVNDVLLAVLNGLPMGIDWGDDELGLSSMMFNTLRDYAQNNDGSLSELSERLT